MTVLVMIFSQSGCGMGNMTKNPIENQIQNEGNVAESGEKENGNPAGTEQDETREEEVPLPHTVLSEDVLLDQLMEMIADLEEEREDSFLTTDMSREQVDQVLSDVRDSYNLYVQYYLADLSYDYEMQEVDTESFITLQTKVVYYDDVVPYQDIRHVETYEEAYRALEEGFETGFETVVLTIPPDLIAENVMWLPEELIWNDSSDMPFGFKKVLHMDFKDKEGNHLITMRLEYDCYGLKEEEQIQASAVVQRQVQDLARSVQDKTKDVPEDSLRKKQCEVLYDLIQEKVDFDYKLNNDLLDLEGNNDPYVATRRSIYGALLYGESVCSGYATAFHEVCKQLGIPSWVLSGYAENGDHAWNMVILDDGKVAYLDPTWGDSTKWHDTYLFMTEETMRKENRRVYDFLYVPDEFYEAGYVEYTAPPCLYD